ncbi:MAG: hypothetical protein AAGH15_03510 [Myxococcota bacterium]
MIVVALACGAEPPSPATPAPAVGASGGATAPLGDTPVAPADDRPSAAACTLRPGSGGMSAGLAHAPGHEPFAELRRVADAEYVIPLGTAASAPWVSARTEEWRVTGWADETMTGLHPARAIRLAPGVFPQRSAHLRIREGRPGALRVAAPMLDRFTPAGPADADVTCGDVRLEIADFEGPHPELPMELAERGPLIEDGVALEGGHDASLWSFPRGEPIGTLHGPLFLDRLATRGDWVHVAALLSGVRVVGWTHVGNVEATPLGLHGDLGLRRRTRTYSFDRCPASFALIAQREGDRFVVGEVLRDARLIASSEWRGFAMDGLLPVDEWAFLVPADLRRQCGSLPYLIPSSNP